MVGRNSRFTCDFGLQKSFAEVHPFATTFATVGSDVMNIGYARASTLDQILDVQRLALRKAACKKIFREKLSGPSRQRPELSAHARTAPQCRYRHRGRWLTDPSGQRVSRSTRNPFGKSLPLVHLIPTC